MNDQVRIALTGFMGVGKSSVARHLAGMVHCQRIDLDAFIEQHENKKIAQIIDQQGLERYRKMETENLRRVLSDTKARILSLGGGTWTIAENRALLKEYGFTSVWLEATFDHCWLNISFSRKDRPLARDKVTARQLFDSRQKVYCLADWHFVIRAGQTSLDVARQIAEEVFG